MNILEVKEGLKQGRSYRHIGSKGSTSISEGLSPQGDGMLKHTFIEVDDFGVDSGSRMFPINELPSGMAEEGWELSE